MEKNNYSESKKDSNHHLTISLPMIDALATGADLEKIQSLNFTELEGKDFKFTKISNLECVPNLAELNLSYNSIDKLDNIRHLKSQKVFNIAENFIKDLTQVQYLTSLVILNVNGNQIDYIPECLGSLEVLETLKISRNKLKDEHAISNLIYIPKLSHLTLVSNPITKIDNYRDTITRFLKRLKYLDNKKITGFETKSEDMMISENSAFNFDKSLLTSERGSKDNSFLQENSNVKYKKKNRTIQENSQSPVKSSTILGKEEHHMNDVIERNSTYSHKKYLTKQMKANKANFSNTKDDYLNFNEMDGTVYIDRKESDLNTSQEKLDVIREQCKSQKKELRETLDEQNSLEKDYSIRATDKLKEESVNLSVGSKNFVSKEISRLKHLIEKTKVLFISEKEKNDRDDNLRQEVVDELEKTEKELLQKIDLNQSQMVNYEHNENVDETDRQVLKSRHLELLENLDYVKKHKGFIQNKRRQEELWKVKLDELENQLQTMNNFNLFNNDMSRFMEKCNMLKDEIGFEYGDEEEENKNITDPLSCCEMLYSLAEKLEEYKNSLESNSKKQEIESTEMNKYMSEIEDLREEKDAIRAERDHLFNEVNTLRSAQEKLKEAIQKEDFELAKLKSLKASSVFAYENSPYGRLGTSGTTNQDFIVELSKQPGHKTTSRQSNMSRDRKISNHNDILTSHNIDQIYGDNILIVNNDTFGVINKGEVTTSHENTEDYKGNSNNITDYQINNLSKNNKADKNFQNSPIKNGDFNTHIMEEQLQELSIKNNVLQESLRAKETRQKSLEAMIEQFEVDIKDLENKKVELKNLDRDLQLRKCEVQNVEQSMEEMKNEMISLADQLSELEQEALQREIEVSKHKQELKELESRIAEKSTVSKRCNELENMYKNKTEQYKDLTDELILKQRELGKVEKLLSENTESYKKTMNQNKEYYENLTEKVKNLEQELAELDIRIPKMRVEDENLTKIVVSLRKEINDKQKLLQGINDNLKYAQEQVDDLKKVISNLQDIQNIQKSEMKRIQDDNDELIFRNKTQKKEEIDLKIDFETYSKMRDNLTRQKDELLVLMALSGKKLAKEEITRINCLVNAHHELKVSSNRL